MTCRNLNKIKPYFGFRLSKFSPVEMLCLFFLLIDKETLLS